MATIFALNNVGFGYNGEEVLTIPTLEIQRGSITGLAGPNGSGKTTLLKLLAHIEKPSAGIVEYKGGSAGKRGISLRQRLSLLPQETYLLNRSVYDNLAYGLKIRNRKEGLSSAINDVLELVGLDQTFAKRQWHELSGGEAQRVALAARLALKPDCMLLDEPTASVDMESAKCIRNAVLIARKEWGTTLIIASHHRSWLNDICDRIIYLYNGRILECSYENVLIGPWKKEDGSTVVCTLSDGQKIYGINKPRPDCSGIISSQALHIHREQPIGEDILTLRGIVSAITLENKQVGPQIHVSCGDQRFVVSTNAKLLEKESYLPGMPVCLTYKKDAITWLEK